MEIHTHYRRAAEGLRLVFIGQLLILVGLVLIWVPLLGSLLAIAGMVAEIVGLYQAGDDDKGYHTAMIFVIIGLVVNLLSGFITWSIVGSLLGAVGELMSLMGTIQVCTTTSLLLHAAGNEQLSRRGNTVMKLYVACTLVSVMCGVLSVVPIIGALAKLVNLVSDIVQAVGYVLFLLFLYNSSKAL